MIVNCNTQGRCLRNQLLGFDNVAFAGLCIARRMIVRDQYMTSIQRKGATEDSSGRELKLSFASFGDNLFRDDTAVRVGHYRNHAFDTQVPHREKQIASKGFPISLERCSNHLFTHAIMENLADDEQHLNPLLSSQRALTQVSLGRR